MKKVIFLDVDGVLNSTESGGGLFGLDRDMVDNLEFLVQRTRAKLILSSTWRLIDHSLALLTKVLLKRGLVLEGATPDLVEAPSEGNQFTPWIPQRGEEVDAWLKDHPEVERYVILDDTDEFFDHHRPFFVKTNDEVGLTMERTDLAIEILNR